MRLSPTVTTVVALAATVPLLAGCTASGDGYETVAVHDFRQRLDASPDAFLLDVRTPEEYAEAHLANATLIPHTDVRARADELPEDKDAPIFVYCRSGNRSAQASATLVDLGYTNVVNLDGGIVDWVDAGYPVET